MGTLFILGIFTFFMNYAYNSPFKDLVPPISDMWAHPIQFASAWKNVITMHEKDKALKANEHRARNLDDVAKRRYFMKTHGIETKDPITTVFGKGEETSVKQQADNVALPMDGSDKIPHEAPVEEPKKKWLGVF